MQFSGVEQTELEMNSQPVVARGAAVLVPCSSRKSVRPSWHATAISLKRAIQRDVETAWRERLNGLPLACQARSLYANRGIQLGRQAELVTGGALYIVSAGLGLVAADRVIPAYGLTVRAHGSESIVPRVIGRFDAAAWWNAVSTGPFSTTLGSLFSRNSDMPVLAALTQPYARLLAPALDALSDAELARVRIVGVGLVGLLPERVSKQILPYDARLESLLPGTKADFSQRALLHFAREGLAASPFGSPAEHRIWVEATLAGRTAPVRSMRPRLSDDEIVGIIVRHLAETRTIGRLLRVLRDREGVACEQARFTRLYRTAVERRVA